MELQNGNSIGYTYTDALKNIDKNWRLSLRGHRADNPVYQQEGNWRMEKNHTVIGHTRSFKTLTIRSR
jgi:hypothetical protein